MLCLLIAAVSLAAEPTFVCHFPIRAITRGPGAHWFGYYDKHQFDPTGRYALGAEVRFEGRKPLSGDVIRLGLIDLQNGDAWTEIGTSRAWSWQQGCMLQWVPGRPSKVIYNDRDGDHFVAVIKDVFSGESRTVPRPVYALAPDGKWAVTTNFARIDACRPGYGYKGVPDPGADDMHPDNDGIYAVNLETGESRLIITYAQIARLSQKIETAGRHWFNHLLFNPDGARFIFLHRAYPGIESKGPWVTRMFTAARDGTALHCVNDHRMVSHFIWRNPRQLLAWAAEPGEGNAFYLYTDQSEKMEVVGKGTLTHDGHCSYSPDGEWLLTDGYPDNNRMQPLLLFRPRDQKLVELGRFQMLKPTADEFRCDLHPRWSRDGRYVSIDSMHEGNQRQIYLIDVGAVTLKPS